MNPILKVSNLSKKVRSKSILNNINFQVGKGEIVGFLGSNGAGKTTTMRIIFGLMSPTGGDVFIDGYSVKREMELALKNVGGIIEKPEMYDFMTGYDNLTLFLRMHEKVDKNKIDYVTKLMGLSESIHVKVKNYSLGMKQRLGIAQAMLHSPKLLILDEPTNGLDPSGIREMRQYLRNLAKDTGISIFLSSHLLSEIEKLCDRIIVIKDGSIVSQEKLSMIKRKDEVEIALHITPIEQACSLLESLGYKATKKNNKVHFHIIYEELPQLNHVLLTEKFTIYTIELVTQSLEDRLFKEEVG